MDLTIEELSLSGWPALQTVLYDGWLLRFAEGHTKRSNSVNALYPGSLGLDEKIGRCEAAYALRGLPAVFKILDPSAGGEAHRALDEALAERGYERVDETSVRTLEIGGELWRYGLAGPGGKLPGPGSPRLELPEGMSISLENRISPAWIGTYCASSKLWARRKILERILANALPTLVAAMVRDEAGGAVAAGYGAVDRGWVGLYDIVVKEERRGRGLGEAMVRSILGGASRRGAERAYLQVVSGNAPAERLYAKLGFEEKYRYWYRRKA